VQYYVVPVLKTASEKDAAAPQEEVAGLSVPVNIKGPFNAIKAKPDVASVVQKAVHDPKAALRDLKETGKTLGKNIKEMGSGSVKALKDLLGGTGLLVKPEEGPSAPIDESVAPEAAAVPVPQTTP
jgi:hypothetical protein